ncbi:MAG: chitin binding domain-containing protein [Rikenellaceae bacterium]|nr:chitin binding domain-containing protein [Rikenellaceae bacterium]MCL2693363.1 chitin binding domain-containing protein [Rikenellaceae bacterium]
MKIRELFPDKILFGINCILTCVFCVMLAGMIYMKSVNASIGSGDCPDGEIPDCIGLGYDYIVFFPHPNACNWFFYCSNGVAYCKKCPADLIWNHWLDSCDFAVNVGYTEEQAAACSQDGVGIVSMEIVCGTQQGKICQWTCPNCSMPWGNPVSQHSRGPFYSIKGTCFCGYIAK